MVNKHNTGWKMWSRFKILVRMQEGQERRNEGEATFKDKIGLVFQKLKGPNSQLKEA